MRKLLYVPVIHTESDLGSVARPIDAQSIALCGEARWAKHKATVARFWQNLADYFASLEAANLKIYQDGLTADGELGRRIIEEGARRGSKNYQLILSLMHRGAEIRKSESVSLLKEEYKYIAKLVQSQSIRDKAIAYGRYEQRKEQLTRQRDQFIARRISQTLKDGETGVLFVGSYHNITPYLPPDIVVEQVKDREKINAYFRELFLGREDERFEPLAEYLASPVTPQGR